MMQSVWLCEEEKMKKGRLYYEKDFFSFGGAYARGSGDGGA